MTKTNKQWWDLWLEKGDYGVTTFNILQDWEKESNRLNNWIRDLQSGMYINCVYCGHRYPPGTPSVRDKGLYEHIKKCPDHPLSKALTEIEELKSLLKDTWMMLDHTELDFRNGVEHMGTDEGQARGLDFFHNLREKIKKIGGIL